MSAGLLAAAMLLDAAFGEPDWLWRRLPHPAVLMGRAVGWCDARLNRGGRRKARGVAVVGGLCVFAAGIGGLIAALPDLGVLEALAAAVLLAQKSLVQHVGAVADALRRSPADGRRSVARIVSRDTAAMDAPAIARAAIESGAENLSDGVIAPAFWFLIGGLPGMMVYKIVNTADSMIGYRTERHREFGWGAARLDDVLNWLPARLTALLIALVRGRFDAAAAIRRDAALHRSPNAGWPEAAMAVCIDVALAGPRSYDGQMRDFPFVNPGGRRDIGPPEIDAAVAVLWQTWALALVMIAAAAVLG